MLVVLIDIVKREKQAGGFVLFMVWVIEESEHRTPPPTGRGSGGQKDCNILDEGGRWRQTGRKGNYSEASTCTSQQNEKLKQLP